MKQRKHSRFGVQFNSYFVTTKAVEGLGVVADMSVGGCLINSPTPVKPGTVLRLRISLPELDLHVQVARAEVRWVKGEQFGLEFKEISADNSGQLKLALSEFEKTRNS